MEGMGQKGIKSQTNIPVLLVWDKISLPCELYFLNYKVKIIIQGCCEVQTTYYICKSFING
jgi:hypothetical protein